MAPPAHMFVLQHQANLFSSNEIGAILVMIRLGYKIGIRGEGVHEGLVENSQP